MSSSTASAAPSAFADTSVEATSSGSTAGASTPAPLHTSAWNN